jgi:hypothetical protein
MISTVSSRSTGRRWPAPVLGLPEHPHRLPQVSRGVISAARAARRYSTAARWTRSQTCSRAGGSCWPSTIEDDDEEYHAFNCTRLSDALDEQRSGLLYFESGRLMLVERHEFHPDPPERGDELRARPETSAVPLRDQHLPPTGRGDRPDRLSLGAPGMAGARVLGPRRPNLTDTRPCRTPARRGLRELRRASGGARRPGPARPPAPRPARSA